MDKDRYAVFVVDANELGDFGLVLAVYRNFVKAQRKANEYSAYGVIGVCEVERGFNCKCGDFVGFYD